MRPDGLDAGHKKRAAAQRLKTHALTAHAEVVGGLKIGPVCAASPTGGAVLVVWAVESALFLAALQAGLPLNGEKPARRQGGVDSGGD